MREIYASYLTRLNRKIYGNKSPTNINQAVIQKSCNQLENIPTFVSGQKASNRYHKYSWPYGVLAKGLCEIKEYKPELVSDTLISYFDEFVASKIEVSSIEECMIGEPLLDQAIKQNNPDYLAAADRIAIYLKKRFNETTSAVSYLGNQEGICFVDSLAMICPFLISYGNYTKDKQYIDFGIKQLNDFIQFGIEPRSGLPFHGYNPSKNNIPVGLPGWGRGVGWLAIAIIDSVIALPSEHHWRDEGIKHIQKLAETIALYQMPDGSWQCLLNRSGQFDSSVTVFLSYFLLKAVKEGFLINEYLKLTDKSIKRLKQCVWANGLVDLAQGNCISMTHMSENFAPQVFVQSMAAAVFNMHQQQARSTRT